MSDDFKCGDVVELKSGGPAMTVEFEEPSKSGKPYLRCVWFDRRTRCDALFWPDMLKRSVSLGEYVFERSVGEGLERRVSQLEDDLDPSRSN